MEPADEYIPEVIPPKPQWQTRNRLPDYAPVVEDYYQPRNQLLSPPNDNTRIDDQELEELRDLGVGIPQRVNRAETVRKAIQRHIDKLESS